MLEIPAYVGQRYETAGANAATSTGTVVTASATTNTKGSYVELIASTAFNASGFWIRALDPSAQGSFLIDIAIGGAGSEQVIVPNVMFGALAGTELVLGMFIPINVPVGSRLSARCQSGGASLTLAVEVILLGCGIYPDHNSIGIAEAIGANTGTSQGTTLTPNATADTYSAWVELIASTAHPIRSLGFTLSTATDGTKGDTMYMTDIAIGGAGSEQVILSKLPSNTFASGDYMIPQTLGPFAINIPAGSRIAARTKASGASAEGFEIAGIGV